MVGDRNGYGFPARLTLLIGGRSRSAFPGYQPQLKLADDVLTSCPVYFIGAEGEPEGGEWRPGETRDVFVHCIAYRHYLEYAVPPPIVELHEWPKRVASGTPLAP